MVRIYEDHESGGRPADVNRTIGHWARAMARQIATLICCLCFALALGGCQPGNNGKTLTTKNGEPESVASITDAYQAGQYQQSYDGALRIRRHAAGSTLDEIDYIAGLSAYQLKHYTDAERYLVPLISRTRDLKLYGSASAALGLVDLDQGHNEQAIVHFKDASRVLTGQDKAEAAYHCGLAYERMHELSQARVQFTIASGCTTDATLLGQIKQEMGTAGWTLQLGAFSAKANADDLANQVRNNSEITALGRPRIMSKQVDDGTLYVVQVGSFFSYESAVRAKSNIKSMPAIVLPLSE